MCDYFKANIFVQSFKNFLAAILGPFMVGSLIDLLGNVTLFLVCSFFFIAALVFMFLVKRGESDITAEERIAKEKAIQELEAKRRELIQEEQPLKDISNQVKNPVIEHPDKETIQYPQEKHTPVSMRKSPITEEIKALVSRLYREGHSSEKIAHTADLSKTEVDLILVDVLMPSMSGLELVKKIREDSKFKDMRIAFLTVRLRDWGQNRRKTCPCTNHPRDRKPPPGPG